MNIGQVIGDIENRNNRMLAAIERWLAAEENRRMVISFEVDGWLLQLFHAGAARDRVIARDWHKPTLVDALAHAASYCQLEAP